MYFPDGGGGVHTLLTLYVYATEHRFCLCVTTHGVACVSCVRCVGWKPRFRQTVHTVCDMYDAYATHTK